MSNNSAVQSEATTAATAEATSGSATAAAASTPPRAAAAAPRNANVFAGAMSAQTQFVIGTVESLVLCRHDHERGNGERFFVSPAAAAAAHAPQHHEESSPPPTASAAASSSSRAAEACANCRKAVSYGHKCVKCGKSVHSEPIGCGTTHMGDDERALLCAKCSPSSTAAAAAQAQAKVAAAVQVGNNDGSATVNATSASPLAIDELTAALKTLNTRISAPVARAQLAANYHHVAQKEEHEEKHVNTYKLAWRVYDPCFDKEKQADLALKIGTPLRTPAKHSKHDANVMKCYSMFAKQWPAEFPNGLPFDMEAQEKKRIEDKIEAEKQKKRAARRRRATMPRKKKAKKAATPRADPDDDVDDKLLLDDSDDDEGDDDDKPDWRGGDSGEEEDDSGDEESLDVVIGLAESLELLKALEAARSVPMHNEMVIDQSFANLQAASSSRRRLLSQMSKDGTCTVCGEHVAHVDSTRQSRLDHLRACAEKTAAAATDEDDEGSAEEWVVVKVVCEERDDDTGQILFETLWQSGETTFEPLASFVNADGTYTAQLSEYLKTKRQQK